MSRNILLLAHITVIFSVPVWLAFFFVMVIDGYLGGVKKEKHEVTRKFAEQF